MDVSLNNKSRTKINESEINSLIEFFSKKYKLKNKEISIALVGDQVMRRLNHKYRGIDKPTDILSFEGDDEDLGELIIDISQLKRQAPFYSTNIEEELKFIILHGLLHLIGYDDESERDRLKMIEMGKNILADFNKKSGINK